MKIPNLLSVNTVEAQPLCSGTCLRNIPDCGGATNCTFKYKCDTFCGGCN